MEPNQVDPAEFENGSENTVTLWICMLIRYIFKASKLCKNGMEPNQVDPAEFENGS